MSEPQRSLTYGEQAVGLTFNPSGDERVREIKQGFADLIDGLDTSRKAAKTPEAHRLFSIAITEAQGAQMWAIKAVTWKN